VNVDVPAKRSGRRVAALSVATAMFLLLAVDLYGLAIYGSLDWPYNPPPALGDRYTRQHWISPEDYRSALARWGGPVDVGHKWPLLYPMSGSQAQCDEKSRLLFIPENGGYDMYMREGCW
jgi:hypothetical protein